MEQWRRSVAGAVAAVRRFPLPLAAGVAGAIAGIILMGDHRSLAYKEPAARCLMTAELGVSLFLAAALVGARRGRATGAVTSVIAALLLVAGYAGLGGSDEWTAIRFGLFMIATHALLALAPLAGKPRGDFRPFNLMLFARTALALLLTHVLYAGLCFGLAAIQHLFDLHVRDEVYFQLWFVLMGVFNTAYVLAGIPSDWDRLEGRYPTPRPLQVVAHLGLLPLSVLYLAILYVYSVKILVVHQWPRGWVSAPIIVFAAIGMLTVLLLDDLGQSSASPSAERNRLARAYSRGFFVALLPLVVLLLLAISRRALEYGLTEERCLVYAVAVFLAVIAPYFVLSRSRHLWAIPLVLAGLALVTAVGPLSARSLAVRSQTTRLRALLQRNELLVHGVLARGGRVSPRDEGEISAALAYLETRHAMAPVLTWRPTVLSCGDHPALASATTARDLVDALGLHFRPWRGAGEAEDRNRWITAPTPDALETAGFDVVFPALDCSQDGHDCWYGSRGHVTQWQVLLDAGALVIMHSGRETARIALAELERSPQPSGDEKGSSQREPLVLEGRTAGSRYRLYVSLFSFERGEGNEPSRVKVLKGILLLQAPPLH